MKFKEAIGKLQQDVRSLRWWKSWMLVIVGSALLAAGYSLFISPYNVVPGGVYGAGIVLHYMFPSVQVGTFGFMLDIPLILIAFKVFGGMFGSKTIVAATLTPIIMNIINFTVGDDPATMFGGKIDLSNDILIACIFGGVLIGAGVGLVLKTRATTGGTDIIAMLVTKYTHMTVSKAILLVDSLVVVFGIIVIGDWRLPLYSLITIFVFSRVIDYVIDGASYDKVVFIISEKHEQLRSFILDEMGRGATYIKSTGMYTRQDKEMIFIVVSRREVSTVVNKLKEVDPLAFAVVMNGYETFGDGFKSFSEKS